LVAQCCVAKKAKKAKKGLFLVVLAFWSICENSAANAAKKPIPIAHTSLDVAIGYWSFWLFGGTPIGGDFGGTNIGGAFWLLAAHGEPCAFWWWRISDG
jgi:hypothetical protein